MLVLTRKPGEKVRIGDSIVVTVLRFGKNNARIGVDAPPGVSILRDEVVDLRSPVDELLDADRVAYSKQPLSLTNH